LPNVSRNSALIAAVLSKSYDIVESLNRSVAERDVEVNSTTALITAVENAVDEKMVKLLVTLGEDPAFETSDGRTPLSVAFMSGKYDIAKFLLKQQSKTRGKLNIDSQNRDGLTVLSILTLAGKNDSIRAICAMPFSANPNLVDRNGRFNGIIDFGDMVYSYRAAEPAICMSYVALGKGESYKAMANILKGYHSKFPLKNIELEAITYISFIRLCISVTMAAWRTKLFPSNKYLLISQEKAWNYLRKSN
jgi:hypothetical protein